MSRSPSHLLSGDRRRWVALVIVCLAQLMIVLDVTIVNVALPAIQGDLGFSQADLTWIVNAYLISFGSFLLLAGRLGDLFGRRRLFIAGLFVFTAASVVCGLAESRQVLIAARFLQGVGGAGSASVILALIMTEFPRESDRARAMGVFAFVATAGGSVGLLLGGVLTQAIDWHWIFFINVPIGIATALAARAVIEPDRAVKRDRPLDAGGAVLITAATMTAIYAIVGAADHGWGSARTLLSAALASALLAGFVLLESRLASPLLPLRILRLRSLTVVMVVRVAQVSGFFVTFFLGALYFERVLGYEPIEIGLAFVPMTVCMGVTALGFSARLMHRFGKLQAAVGGMALMTAGLALMATVGAESSYLPRPALALALIGCGSALGSTSLFTIALSEVPRSDAGLGSGIAQVSIQLSGAFGLAVLSTLAHERTESRIADGESALRALVDGYSFAYVVAAIALVVGMAIAVIGLRNHTGGAVEAAAESPSAA